MAITEKLSALGFKIERLIVSTIFLQLGLLITPHGTFAQEAVFHLEGLVVTASPLPREMHSIANHITILEGEEIRARGKTTVAEALRELPGVTVVRGGSYGAVTSVFLRGGESDYTLVLVDGVQANEAGGNFDFASLTTDNIERIEILRGPASALYGSDAIAGVIHIITKLGQGPPSASVSYNTGSFGKQDVIAEFGTGTERAAYSMSIASYETSGILPFNNQNSNKSLSGNARLRPDDDTDLAMGFRLASRKYHYPTDGSGAVVDRNSFFFGDHINAHANLTRAISPNLSFQTLVGLNQTSGGTDDAPDNKADSLGYYGYTSSDQFRRASGEVKLHANMQSASASIGFEYEHESQNSFTESLSQYGATYGKSRNDRDNRAYFIALTNSHSKISYNLGGRLEDNERFGSNKSWQAGATWTPGANLAGPLLKVAVGTGIKEPTFYENFATGFVTGNPNLNPEQSTSWEFGAEQNFIQNIFRISATYFNQKYRDVIQYVALRQNPLDPNFLNVAKAESKGLELEAQVDLQPVQIGSSWTLLRTRVTDSGFDEGNGATFVEGQSLLRRPGRKFSSWVRLASTKTDISVHFSRIGERDDRDFSTYPATRITMPTHNLFSIESAWRILRKTDNQTAVTFRIKGENLLDENYQEILGFQAPGRNLTIGITAHIN